MFEIQADMKLSKQDNIMAYGMVTVDRSLRFMVQLRKYTDKNGEEKMFLSYPRREQNGVWNDVVRPNQEMQKKIQETVAIAVQKEIKRDMHLPHVEVIELMLSEIPPFSRTPICAVATVQISGLTITGITVKRGERGLFINMPQYRQPDKTYKDLVYAITKEVQNEISNTVIAAYKQAKEEDNGHFY